MYNISADAISTFHGLGGDGSGITTAQNITDMTVDVTNAAANLINAINSGKQNNSSSTTTGGNSAGENPSTWTPRTTNAGSLTTPQKSSTPDWLPWAIGGGLLLVGIVLLTNNKKK